MNFLAHTYLSGKDEDLVLGNFIADSVKGIKYKNFPEGVQKGIILHRAIDYFTDTHPIARRSASRLFEKYGHYNGVIIDIFYDHFLAVNWAEYSAVPLEIFVQDFYQLLSDNFALLPTPVKRFLPFMVADNWLLSYANIEGISRILHQMNMRTKKISQMNLAVKELEQYYEDFQEEFRLFFPEIQIYVKKKIQVL